MSAVPSASRSPFTPRKVNRRAPLLVFVIGAVFSVWVFFYIRSEEGLAREREFQRRAQNIALRAEDYLNRREETIYALRSVLETSPHVTRAQFEHVANDLLSRQVGIHALEWVPIVPGTERARYVAEARADGFADFEFTEHPDSTSDKLQRSTDRPVHAPVFYLVPYVGNEPALGYDLASASPAWEHLQEFAKHGVLAASGRLPLLVTARGGPAWGYITELPVYNRPSATLKPEERLAQLKGYVLGIFELSEVLEDMFHRMSGLGIDVLFLDGSAPAGRQFLHYHAAAKEAAGQEPPTAEAFATGVHTRATLEHAGRTWVLWMRPSAALTASQSAYRSWFFGTLFFSISATLSLLLLGLQRRTESVERLVTERTTELAESRRKLDTFLQSLPGMAYRGNYDAQFDITFVSEGCVALTGHTPEDFLSRRLHLRDLIHPDDLARVRAVTRECFETGHPIEVEYRIRTSDGLEKWVLSRGRPVHHRQPPPVFEGLLIDITPQKRAEQDRLALERKLLEGQKLESLGLLAGGIAHDFNNLLTGVLGNASLARLALPANAPVEPQLRAIEQAALRAAELCRQMLAYAGKGRFIVEPVDLSALTEGLLPLLKISVARHAELQLALAPDLPAVMADATQLRQIVMNLVLNAADAIGDRGGTITLATGATRVDAEWLRACAAGADLPAGDYVFLEIRDTGAGMTPEVMARIFDPFFTTKFAGRGLGLAATLGIVRGHHGALRVMSTPGQGSTFRLLLPPTATRGASDTAKPTSGDWRRAGLVLVIEDEEPVRAVAANLLKSFGLTVRETAEGNEGLAVFRENPLAFDLVLLDLMMPGLSGEETLQALRAIRPEVRVLIMSGYNEGDLLRRLANDRAPLAFLPKPFTRDVLVEKLRALLG